VNLERDEGRWVIRTNQPTSATGEPYERSTDEPSPTVTGGARQWEVEGVEVVERHQLGFPRRDDRGTSEDGYRDRDWFEADEPSLTITEKARSFTHRIVRSVNTGRDWKPGEDRSHAQTIDPHEQPAPAVTAKSGGQWQLNPGATASRPEQAARRSADVANRRHYELDEPAPTIAFGHDAAAWCWQRPATTVAGDPRVWPPGHKVNQSDRDRLGEAEANEKYGDRAGTEAIRLEVHEAALLQTFPVDYPWQGNRTSQFQQVGNAVPPLLGFHVLVEAMTVRRRPAPARRLEPHGDAEAVALF
jgi:site-specific DNA-cytosine methylase